MNFNLSLAERLLYSTVKVTALNNGTALSTGTGFFTWFSKEKGTIIPMLITNKHVIEGADQIHIKCHMSELSQLKPTGKYIDVTVLLHDTVIEHPNMQVDLCAISIGAILQQALAQNTPIFYTPITLDAIPTSDEWSSFDAIEDVTMVGCPNGISDTVNNFPIVRQGVTATSPAINYNGQNEFLIDVACFPGSSGSPVFLYNSNGYFDKNTNQYLFGVQRLKLLGILYAGPHLTSTGQVILTNPTQFSINTMMHLGCVINSTELQTLATHVLNVV